MGKITFSDDKDISTKRKNEEINKIKTLDSIDNSIKSMAPKIQELSIEQTKIKSVLSLLQSSSRSQLEEIKLMVGIQNINDLQGQNKTSKSEKISLWFQILNTVILTSIALNIILKIF